MTAPFEELLREALARLSRQEERTDALEAAVLGGSRPVPVAASTAETVVASWPKRVPPPAPRPSRAEPAPPTPLPPSAPPVVPRDADRAALEAQLAEAEQRAREAEAVLRGAVNLATAGRVAAGVAHDFHNLLGVIVGNADLLREALPADDPKRELAETIARTAQTVAGLSRKVLSVGRPGASHAVPLDVSATLRALDPILRRLVGKPVALTLDLAPELPLIRVDAIEFDRTVLNLVLNARDASATGGGSIGVRAARADRPTGPHVALTVSDTGCGMSAEVRKRMFDLFFTTKGDRGTGLGLATVRDAVAEAGGTVEVESEVGWGTQVRVYWPALRE